MIGRADIEGSKSNVAMNAWLPQAGYPSHLRTLRYLLTDVPPRPNSPTTMSSAGSADVRPALGGCSTPGKVPEGTLPVRPPPAGTRRPALAAGAARAVHRAADGLRARDPRARPSSQSFSRGYGSILPTSLAYIVPSTERLFTLETMRL
ncbi:unnamed protein product [Prunus brigantina]